MSKDPKAQTKGQTSAKTGAPPPVDEGFSLDELDGLILNQDPEFLKSLKELSTQNAEGDLGIELLDLDQLLVEEEAKSLRGRIKRAYRNLKNRFIIFYTGVQASIVHFIRSGIPELFGKLKEAAKKKSEQLAQKKREFSYLNTKTKMFFFAFLGLSVLTAVFVWKAATQELLPVKDELFIRSIGEYADYTYEYDPQTETELFYDSIRATQNIVQLKKIVVNIKKTSSTGPNPMAAFEFYVEGNTPEVVIELKDREYEVRDLIQRDIEDMTFDQVDNPEGRKIMIDKLKRDVNRILNKGRIKNIYINTFLVKP